MSGVTIIGMADWQPPADSGEPEGKGLSSAELGLVAFERALVATRAAMGEQPPPADAEVSDGVPVDVPPERSRVSVRLSTGVTAATTTESTDALSITADDTDMRLDDPKVQFAARETQKLPTVQNPPRVDSPTFAPTLQHLAVDTSGTEANARPAAFVELPAGNNASDGGDVGPSTPTRVMYTTSGDTPSVDDIRAGTVTPRHARMVVGEGENRVALNIRLGEDGVRVHAQTATPDAAAALENASSELGESMRERGMALASFSAASDNDPDAETTPGEEIDGSAAAADESVADDDAADDPYRRGVRAIA